MTQSANAEVMGATQCDPVVPVDLNGIVGHAFDVSGAEGMLVLEAEQLVLQSPFRLIALIGSLIYLLAPEGPRPLRLYTYDVLDFGCVEIRGARPMSALPAELLREAHQLGAKVHLVGQEDRSAVLITVPSARSVMH